MKKIILTFVSLLFLASCSFGNSGTSIKDTNITPTLSEMERENLPEAYFAGGCFWCMESIFESQEGVLEAVVGYMGGSQETATYKQTSAGNTQHREAVRVVYNPGKISYEKLVELFWTQIDPTDDGGQFNDRGYVYSTAILYNNDTEKQIAEASKLSLQESGRFEKDIVTKIEIATPFYDAEQYHQNYYKENSVRYKLYTSGSGRKQFIEENWQDRIEELLSETFLLNSSVDSPHPNPLPKGEGEATIFPQSLENSPQPSPIGEGEATISPIGKKQKVAYTDAELKEKLTPLQYTVTQEDGTEPPFDNAYWDNKQPGIYVDIIDGTPLYSSLDKFDSGTGWPSFTKPISEANITRDVDTRFFMTRTEIRSASSDAHLGHIFEDAPIELGGIRHCINSASLRFIPVEELEREGYGEYVEMFQ